MAHVLGLDCGGTKTLGVVVASDATIVALHAAHGFDPTSSADAKADLRALLAPYGPVVAATLGLPYFGELVEVSDWQGRIGAQMLGPQTRVCNDVAVAHLGAFAGQDGVLILAGTGSMAWAQGPAGVHRTGGYGDLFGDEGSAYWIGQRALAMAARDIDGRAPADGFAHALCQRLGTRTDALIDWTYGQTKRRVAIAAIAREIGALADQDVAGASAILRDAAAELALAGQAAARLAALPAPTRWSMAGGVFANTIIRTAMTDLMGRPPEAPHLPPVGGAVLDAARRAGWTITPSWIATLATHLSVRGIRPADPTSGKATE